VGRGFESQSAATLDGEVGALATFLLTFTSSRIHSFAAKAIICI
jgi:hypothetical protein